MKKCTNLIFRFLITIVLTLIVLILIKSNSKFKNSFYKNIYDTNLSFSYFENLYNKYIGNSYIFSKYINTQTVFNETISYNSKEKYEDGVKLYVDSNYLVPINESGVVVFIGQKEKYSNTVIIQRIDGVDEWYGNLSNVNVELYDYVEKGDLLGDVNNYFYLVYRKDGNILNYEEYIK